MEGAANGSIIPDIPGIAEFLKGAAANYAPLLKGLAAGSAVFFVLTPAAAPVLLILMPQDILIRRLSPPSALSRRIPWFLGHLIKNLIGILLILLGFLLLFLPGQGILTLFTGLLFVNIPGKKRLLSRIIGSGRVRPLVERLRKRCRRAPMIFPD